MKLYLSMNKCNDKNIEPTVQSINIKVQKNKVSSDKTSIIVLKTANEINMLFNGSAGKCDVKSWYLSAVGNTLKTPLDKADAISIRMQQPNGDTEDLDFTNTWG